VSREIDDGLREFENELWDTQPLTPAVGTMSRDEFDRLVQVSAAADDGAPASSIDMDVTPVKREPTAPPMRPVEQQPKTMTASIWQKKAMERQKLVQSTQPLVVNVRLPCANVERRLQPRMVPKSPMARRETKVGAISRFYPAPMPSRAPKLDPKSPRKVKTRHSANPPVEPSVGWLLQPRAPGESSMQEAKRAAQAMPIQALANAASAQHASNHPSHTLLQVRRRPRRRRSACRRTATRRSCTAPGTTCASSSDATAATTRPR